MTQTSQRIFHKCVYCTKLEPISKIANVPLAERVPPSGFEKAVEFCVGAIDRNRTCI